MFAADERVSIAVMTSADDEFQLTEWPHGGALVAEGPAKGLAVYGPIPQLVSKDSLQVSGDHSGCGWISRGSRVHEVDDTVLDLITPIDIPFWHSCRIDGRVWSTGAATWHPIARFSCTDPAARNFFRFSALGESAAYAVGPHSHRFHLGVARFTVKLPPACKGIVIRKEYDRMQGRQRARVWANNQLAGVWAAYEEAASERCAVSKFCVGPEFLNQGPNEIAIDPPAGSPLWNWHAYEICAFT